MRTLKKHFSFSQFRLWESSPKSYWFQYAIGDEGFDSDFLSKGRDFMTALELGIYLDPDPLLPEIIESIDKYENVETWVGCEFPISEKEHTSILSKIDSSTTDLSKFIEYKTGKYPWDQDSVDSDDQMLFYATVIYLDTGNIPKGKLIWIQTEEDDYGNISYTGNVFKFDRVFKKVEINRMINRIGDAIQAIKEYVFSEVEINEVLAEKYASLVEQKNKIDSALETIKNEIVNNMVSSGENYGTSSIGDFTLANRISYIYSEKVEEATIELNKIKKEERFNGVATKTETPYLKFIKKKFNIK